MTPDQPDTVETSLDDIATDEIDVDDVEAGADSEPASPVDDVPMQAWITIGLFVLVGIIFAAVCLPLIM